MTIRMCGYPPFGAQLILNGHGWVEREAQRKCLTTVMDGNCFVEGSDFAAVNRVARFRLLLLGFQVELSRNLVLLRGTTMNEVYRKPIDRTRAPLHLKPIKTIFGFSHRPHYGPKRDARSSRW